MESPITDLLVIGAGPYGLSAAAYAKARGLSYRIVGRPMAFWRESMPKGMFLRSSADWHMDPLNEFTFRAFLEESSLDASECDPIPLDLYLRYTTWFRQKRGIDPEQVRIASLSRDSDGLFHALTETGETIVACNVLCAPGMGFFPVTPPVFQNVDGITNGSISHTSRLNSFEGFDGKRVAIVGGRQSAFEYAALIAEAGAREVHIVHRHPTPSFEPSDWTWIEPLMQACGNDAGWYRSLPAEEREQITRRFWAEGRLKLEPWLTDRLASNNVQFHEGDNVTSVRAANDQTIDLTLESGHTLNCDRVVLATGFKVDLTRIPYLDSILLDSISTRDGYPALSSFFESSVPGLYFTGFCAVRDFGPFFGFVRACNISATTIVEAIQKKQAEP